MRGGNGVFDGCSKGVHDETCNFAGFCQVGLKIYTTVRLLIMFLDDYLLDAKSFYP